MNSPDAVPQIDFTDAVDRQYAFIRRVLELNHQYARSLAEATNTLTGVTRSQFESVGSAMREQAQAVSGAAQRGLESVGQAARAQAEQAELVELVEVTPSTIRLRKILLSENDRRKAARKRA